MKTFTLLHVDGGLEEEDHFDSYEDLVKFVDSYIDEGIEVKVIINTWECVDQKPYIYKTPFK